jgi:hypothetical protein
VASLGVGVFDVLALQAALLVKARAGDPWKAAGAQIVMVLSVLSSSAVNGAHGWMLGGWTTAVVLGAAPVTFEVAFAIKYRTLTALIWILFARESMTRLKHEAWSRIALPDVPDPVSGTVERDPDPIRIPPEQSGPVPELAPVERIGIRPGIRNQVADLYGSGIKDPESIVREIPGANPESVRRYIREIRKSGS